MALEDFDLIEHRKLTHPVNPDNAASLIALKRSAPAMRPGRGALADPLGRHPSPPPPAGSRTRRVISSIRPCQAWPALRPATGGCSRGGSQAFAR
ncbi:MAG: hypothetical protein ACOC05_04165, partial [Oceanicaulis sp.]